MELREIPGPIATAGDRRFRSRVKPEDTRVVEAIEALL